MQKHSYHGYSVSDAILDFDSSNDRPTSRERVVESDEYNFLEDAPSQRLFGIEMELEFDPDYYLSDDCERSDIHETIEVYHDEYGHFEVDNPFYDPDLQTLENYISNLDYSPWFQIAEDGSLANGFEVVSAPLSHKCAQHFFSLSGVQSMWTDSEKDYGTNGIHIHVFDNKRIYKTRLAYIFSKIMKDLAGMTRRSDYAEFYDEYFDNEEQFVKGLVNRYSSIFRLRGALNLMGDVLGHGNHVEFRFFSVPYSNLYKVGRNYVNFVNQILDIASEFKMYQLMRMNFSIDHNFEISYEFTSDPEVEPNLWVKAKKQYGGENE